MSLHVDRVTFPYEIETVIDDLRWNLYSLDRKPFNLQSAFHEYLQQSEIPPLKAAHQFFSSIVSLVLDHQQDAVRYAFLDFNHDDDDGPTFDDHYSKIIREAQRHLIDGIRRAVQNQFQGLADRQFVQNLLDQSGVNSLLLQATPESLLAKTHNEEDLARKWERDYKEREYKASLGGNDNFELILAKYHIRQQGLKLRDSEELLSRLTVEIRQRTTAYFTQAEESIQEQGVSDQVKPKGSHTETRKLKRAKRPEPGRIWNHLTISRDETSASDYLHDRIIIVFLKTNIMNSEPTEASKNSMGGTGRTEGPEITELHQQTQPYHTGPDAVVGQPLSHQIFSEHTLLGMQSNHKSYPAFEKQEMNVTDNGTLMVRHEDDESNSMVSTPDCDSMGCRQLISRVASLELENKRLQNSRPTNENWKIIHFITTSPGQEPSGYFDKPVMTPGLKHGDFTLRAFLPVTDVNSYVKQSGLDFAVSRFYSASSLLSQVRSALAKKQPPPEPVHYREHIQLQSQQMLEVMQEFLSLQPGFWDKFPGFDVRAPIDAPYIFWYMYRSTDILQQLQHPQRDLVRMLTSWIDENYTKKYAEAESHLERGVVTLRTMPFLICPGDVLIWKEKTKLKAAVTSSLVGQTSEPILYWDSSQSMWSDYKPEKGTKKGEFSTTWAAEAWNYKFIGQFYRQRVPIEIKFRAASLEQEVNISKLAVYPLRFADEKTRLQLETRGRTFWSCRIRNMVSYTGEEGVFTNGERFMVDFQIYKELHSDSLKFQLLYEDEDDDEDNDDRFKRKMSSDEMESETPPSQPDIYVFPDTVPGFNLRSKKWVDLEVDRITDVKWNKKSFDSLVIDARAKEMIQALVSHQIESEKGTDLIHRKGNGLIILLHGGPGTGKTFTAESVAEIAQKPLFCVTCGDIGTKPEEVEKYLESVLYLGKTWGCVVLIDEAEVFLEQRSLENLERNALVSVFLRVLEYYEGILILTTNRVGTFDEAFKSRILLSLHYEKLSKGQRRKIWRGFINHLEDTHGPGSGKESGRGHNEISSVDMPDIDYQEIRDYLDELASHELNGRQIRNIITTARQLAKFRRRTLDYGLLQEVISLSGKFDEYFSKLNENQSDEQIARSDGLR